MARLRAVLVLAFWGCGHVSSGGDAGGGGGGAGGSGSGGSAGAGAGGQSGAGAGGAVGLDAGSVGTCLPGATCPAGQSCLCYQSGPIQQTCYCTTTCTPDAGAGTCGDPARPRCGGC